MDQHDTVMDMDGYNISNTLKRLTREGILARSSSSQQALSQNSKNCTPSDSTMVLSPTPPTAIASQHQTSSPWTKQCGGHPQSHHEWSWTEQKSEARNLQLHTHSWNGRGSQAIIEEVSGTEWRLALQRRSQQHVRSGARLNLKLLSTLT